MPRTCIRIALMIVACLTAHPLDASANGSRTLTVGDYTIEPIAEAAAGERAIALRDPAGALLGLQLDEADFCKLAASGAAVIGMATYRVIGTAASGTAFCGRYYSRLNRKQPVAAGALGRSRFERVEWPHGIGVLDYKLVPLRTLAADRIAHPPGTVYFVAALAGRPLPDGTRHDGYLVVTDSLGTLAADRVEIFRGVAGRALARDAIPDALAVSPVTDPATRERVRAAVRWASRR